ncbi:hypothetical protein [Pseudomonas panipatensis]|uniref:DUF4239 domain-containing protein n=1 Tax=Pseudomonas panipatensis TaxID=428992 RepID=A0A1G8FSV6_9PSED|nr:hypothetical protein [Pseudomonas panipatensis]SDH85238.1 hypothetical protein SAMN05216272_103436 [Pseudomonas panipatensis]SMP52376.1 hypothetical protein SAMN06295951_10323 [Pseudomonas panipatensis]
MNHLLVATIVFVCLFGSALLGSLLRRCLPTHHLSEDSISVVKLATGLIATMAALVLGLLVSSAKGTFDTANAQLVGAAAKVIQFDRTLSQYGTETEEIRGLLKHNFAAVLQVLESRDSAQLALLDKEPAVSRAEDLQRRVQALLPATDAQRQLKARALQLMDEVFAMRWLTLLQANGSIPLPMLAILVVWICVIFATFGLFAPGNGTIMAVVGMCALSVASSVLLVEELNRPLDGLISVSLEPMRHSLSRLGE